MRRTAALSSACIVVQVCALLGAETGGRGGDQGEPAGDRILHVEATTAHGPQKPSAVPLLPGLHVGKQLFYGPLVGRPAPGQGYQPIQGDSYAVHNGKGVHNFVLTTGAWWLHVGDRPRLHLAFRPVSGAYASPGLLPDLGVTGAFRLTVTAGGKTKYLDEFARIDAVLSPGEASWTCVDDQLGLTVKLRAEPLIEPWGFVATAEVSSQGKPATLAWETSKVALVADREGYAEFSTGKYTRLFLGSVEKGGRAEKGRIVVDVPGGPPDARHATQRSRLLCVWGYSDYNRQGVADACKRLEFRPFDPLWLEGMKKKWFDHWIGGGLEPEKKFLDARQRCDEVVRDAEQFWARQAARLRIKTPDARFDNVVNHVSAHARVQFEYPGFIHGLTYSKYGKINHGCYGFDAAGMHEEVADTLHFVAGTQDVTGRQRYFMTTFAISNWHEDMDFYFPEQCWYHWRWTGDERFLRAIWPAARRALEHGLAVSDPDGDGLMTGFYEMWNSDQNNPGGFSALQTAMGWAGLRAGRDMAAALGDRDFDGQHGGGRDHDPDYARRYGRLMAETEKQYLAKLWQNDVGAWSSAEVNGVNRPRPHTCEQNYAIWRGLGTPERNYMAMRYIRENLHHGGENGSVFEYINDWWPIQWSHHYVASGDTCASFHSACAAGDVDGHWPAFKTIAESAYLNSGAMWQGTGSNAMELEPLFLQAVVDGLFGLKPWFGQNLLVVRPSPLAGWDDLEIKHSDAAYRFHRDNRSVVLHVTTPVPRRIRAELPVRAALEAVSVDGKPAKYSLESAVGAARVVVEADAAIEHRFEVRLAGDPAIVSRPGEEIGGHRQDHKIRDAEVTGVRDPQKVLLSPARIRGMPSGEEVRILPWVGKATVFLELRAGEVKWLHPLDLDANYSWKVVQRCMPAFHAGGPRVASPAIDVKTKTLTMELVNHHSTEQVRRARITVAGQTFEQDVKVRPSGTLPLRIPLEAAWDRITPGSIRVGVYFWDKSGGEFDVASDAVTWDLGKQPGRWANRMRPVDLSPHYNAAMDKLFSPGTQWRIDYTGAQHGVDRRHPMPLRDERGYVLMNSVLSIFEYGTLPEQVPALKRIKFAMPKGLFDAGCGVPFRTEANRILAICCTQPYQQFPSSVTVKLPRPLRAEKLYLLTGNLVKTLKCYYPGAEVIEHYADGSRQLHQMIPPYTMPSIVGHICPRAHPVRVGTLEGGGNPVADTAAYLSVTDVDLDPAMPVAAIELRCVATETLLGVAGMTLLEAMPEARIPDATERTGKRHNTRRTDFSPSRAQTE